MPASNERQNRQKVGFLNDFKETFVKVRSRARCGVSCFDIHQHQLEVRHFTATALTNAQASGILAGATEVLKTDDGAGDVSCAIKFSQEAVAEFRSDVAVGALCACCFPGWHDGGGVIPFCLMAA